MSKFIIEYHCKIQYNLYYTSSMALLQAKPPKKSTRYGEGSEITLNKKNTNFAN